MKYAETVGDLIGNTPLVRLNRVVGDLEPTVLAKVEYLNPGGSVKDRIAVRMIDAAETPRVAAQQAPAREHGAAQRAELTDGADGVLGTGGVILAPTREHR